MWAGILSRRKIPNTQTHKDTNKKSSKTPVNVASLPTEMLDTAILIDDDEEMEPININNEDMLDPMHDSSEDECFEYGANGDCDQLDDEVQCRLMKHTTFPLSPPKMFSCYLLVCTWCFSSKGRFKSL